MKAPVFRFVPEFWDVLVGKSADDYQRTPRLEMRVRSRGKARKFLWWSGFAAWKRSTLWKDCNALLIFAALMPRHAKDGVVVAGVGAQHSLLDGRELFGKFCEYFRRDFEVCEDILNVIVIIECFKKLQA